MEKNPNSIGAPLGFNEGIPMSGDKVYRSLGADEAIKDIYDSGVVRSKASAGLPGRYGDTVYWSKGKDGRSHMIGSQGYVIEAPHNVAEERIVTLEDLTAIYTKMGTEVVNLLNHKEEVRKERIHELRQRLGIIK